jgi:hypothetical protein
MPGTSILFGRLLILLGILGYGYGLYAGTASVTALIPAFFGVVIMLLGHLAQAKEGLRKHLMHAAVVVALLGFIAVAVRLVPRLSTTEMSVAVISQILMALLCLIFVILAIKSFMDARRNA